MEVQNVTGFGNGLYTDQEKNGEYYDSKEKKILFLRKAIEMV